MKFRDIYIKELLKRDKLRVRDFRTKLRKKVFG